MGDPKFLRRRFEKPKHPWEAGRMEEERQLLKRFGLKNKRELWKAESKLRGFRRQARDLQARLRAAEPQAERETAWLLARLKRLGVLRAENPSLDDVLALGTPDLLSRRFASVVHAKGLAPTVNGARQMIVHGHFAIGERRVTRPGFLVPAEDERRIDFSAASPVAQEDHPIRVSTRQRPDVQARAPPEGGAAGPPGPSSPSGPS
jgi:small subunit ribosomal protein S4